MATVRVTWSPINLADVNYYQLYKAGTITDTFWLVTTIQAVQIGANFDTVKNKFFYDDATGTLDTFYKVIGYSTSAQVVAESQPFNPSFVQDSILANKTRVDENYGGQDALRYMAPGGTPIPQAEIRIYKNEDYLQGNRSTPLAILETKDDGRWVTSVYLDLGSYVIQFFKSSGFGPDIVTITV